MYSVILWRFRLIIILPGLPLQAKRAPSWIFKTAGNNKAYFGLHAEWPIFMPDLKRICNTKVHKTPPSGSCANTYEQKDGRTNKRTRMTMVINALRHLVKSP